MSKNQKIFLASTLALLLLMGGIVALVIDAFTNVPDFHQLRDKVKIPIILANGEKSSRWVGPNAPGWTPIRHISNYFLSAVISSEDTTFYIHKGVDYHELHEAIKKDFEEKRWARGASTITEQVIKNAFLSRHKTLWRKLKEFLWAPALEKVLSKSEILCFYANMVELGPGIYGIRNASNHYFSKSPGDLTPRESAFLAMLLPSPVRYHQYFARKQMSSWATRRVDRILLVMNSMGFIDESVYRSAMGERLWGELPSTPSTQDSPVSITAPEEDFTDDTEASVPQSAAPDDSDMLKQGATSQDPIEKNIDPDSDSGSN